MRTTVEYELEIETPTIILVFSATLNLIDDSMAGPVPYNYIIGLTQSSPLSLTYEVKEHPIPDIPNSCIYMLEFTIECGAAIALVRPYNTNTSTLHNVTNQEIWNHWLSNSNHGGAQNIQEYISQTENHEMHHYRTLELAHGIIKTALPTAEAQIFLTKEGAMNYGNKIVVESNRIWRKSHEHNSSYDSDWTMLYDSFQTPLTHPFTETFNFPTD